jgi:2-dehydropantoate 2-reductase
MRVAVLGTGAVGAYFGGRLAQAGHAVTFIARGRTLEALRERGLHVESIAGDLTLSPVQATDAPAQVGVVDLVVLGVKAWQVPAAAEAMRPMVGPDTIALPLQNGVEAHDQLAAALGAEHVLGGVCRILAFQAGPGFVRHTSIDPSIALGEWDGKLTPRVTRLAEAFSACTGVEAQVPASVQAAVWEKLAFIAPMGAAGGVTRAPVGVVRSLPETRAMLVALIEEVCVLARARGIPIRPDLLEWTLGRIDPLPPGATSSMVRDLLDGRPSELDAQCGVVARLGAEKGVPVPLHTFAYHALLPLERKARGELQFPA